MLTAAPLAGQKPDIMVFLKGLRVELLNTTFTASIQQQQPLARTNTFPGQKEYQLLSLSAPGALVASAAAGEWSTPAATSPTPS